VATKGEMQEHWSETVSTGQTKQQEKEVLRNTLKTLRRMTVKSLDKNASH